MLGLGLTPALRFISVVFSTILLSTLPAYAVNSGVSYQGRILKPDGSPLEGSNVQFRIQIRSPGSENCLLYEEQQSLDMRSSKGVFSLTLNDGSGARLDASGFPIDRLFANSGTMNFVSGACAIGTSYAPNEADGRKLIVQFKDETMSSWEPMPATNINFVPLALESKQIQGFSANSLVRVQEADGTMGNVSPLSNASYTELLALIAGSSTQYVRNGTSAGARVPTYTGNPSSPVAGSIWFDSSSNQLKYRDSSGVQAVGTATGSVTSVTAGSGLATTPVGGITSTGSIEIAVGGVVSTMLADGSVVTAKIADGAVTDVKLANGSVLTAKIADGAVTTLKLADSSVTSAKIDDGTIVGGDLAPNIVISTTGGITASGFTTSGTVTANAVTATTVSSGVNITRQIQLFDPDAGSINKVTFNADSALASDYTLTWPLNDGTANQVLMTDGTGKLSWTTITPGTGDFKADGTVPMAGNLRLNSNWLSNDGGNEGIRIDNSGYVGIGTASPQELLDIAGAIRVGTTTTCGAPNPGTIRYNSGNLEYCNGTAWQVLGIAGSNITALTGDVTATGPGSVAATIANSAVTSAKIADGTIATADVADKAVTFAKIQDIATNKLVGRSTASSGAMEELSVGTGLSLSGGTLSTTLTGLPSCASGELAIYITSTWTCVGATSANTASTVVRRDSSGNFVSGSATLTSSLVLKDGASGGQVSIATPVGFTNYALTLPVDDGTPGQILSTDGSGILSWITGGGDFKADGTVPMTGNLRLNSKWLSNDGENEGIRVDNTGKVGIGTATPNDLLTVSGGNFSVTGSADAFATIIAPNGGGRAALNFGGRGGSGTNSWITYTGSADTNLYFSSGNNINGNPIRMTLTGGGNVGIGTTTPATALEVTGDVTLSTGADRTIAVATPATGNGNALTIKAANGASSTNYGGGLTLQTGNGYWGRPGASLTMGASAFSGGNVTLIAGMPDNAGAAGTTTIQGGPSAGLSTGGAVYIKGGIGGSNNQNGGAVQIVGGPGGGTGVYGNILLGWDGSAARGNVGIGTGSPSSTLDVAGSVNASASITSGNIITATNTNSTAVSTIGVYGSSATSASGTAGVKGVVSNAGYVNGVVGHATNTGGASYATGVFGQTDSGTGSGVSGLSNYQWSGYVGKGGSFEAKGPDAYGLYALNSASSGNAIAIYVTSPNSANGYAIYSPNGRNYFAGDIGVGVTAPSEKIEVAGNVKATSFITTSDARLKEDIARVPGLEAVLKLKGVHWAWKDSHKPDMGVLAQDVEKVFPDAVVTDPRTGFKAVKYQALVAPLIESTKELYGMTKANEVRNETQAREIASLKSENEKLKSEVDELKRKMERIEELLSKKK